MGNINATATVVNAASAQAIYSINPILNAAIALVNEGIKAGSIQGQNVAASIREVAATLVDLNASLPALEKSADVLKLPVSSMLEKPKAKRGRPSKAALLEKAMANATKLGVAADPATIKPKAKRGRPPLPSQYVATVIEAKRGPEGRPVYASKFENPNDAIQSDAICCLIDGRPLQVLKRYLRSKYNMSWSEYRKMFNLPKDYPSCSPRLTKMKRAHASEINFTSGTQLHVDDISLGRLAA